MAEKYMKRLSLKEWPLAREYLAEMLGTFILVTVGDGAVAQLVLSGGDFANPMSVFWGFCLGLTLGVYVAGSISGGHLNPAVTLAFAVIGRFPWVKVPTYFLAQYVGAFLASCCVFGVYYDAFQHFDDGERELLGANGTAGIFSNYPKPFVSVGNGFSDQLFGTFLLVMLIMAVTDDRNSKPAPGLVPVAVGFVLFAVGVSFGYNCGFAVNPARDLGPRIFTAVAGWGDKPFSFRGFTWFWVPVLAAHVGGVLGALAYLLLIGLHWPDPPRDAVCLHDNNMEDIEIETRSDEDGKKTRV